MSTFNLIVFLLNIFFVGFMATYVVKFIKFYKDPRLVSRKKSNLNMITLSFVIMVFNIFAVVLRIITLI